MSRAALWVCRWGASVVLATWLSACSTPPPTPQKEVALPQWSGRMALQITAPGPDASAQSFSASFYLQGSPVQGRLEVFNPLGTQVAALSWGQGWAQLQQGEQLRRSAALSDLVRISLGAEIPIDALFAWLQGRPIQVSGWQVNLSQYAQGRISAQRWEPLPQAQLKIILQP